MAAEHPTREELASLLAALHYGQYSTNEDKKNLDRNIERALRNFDIGLAEFVPNRVRCGLPMACRRVPITHVGESKFEAWYSERDFDGRYRGPAHNKQDMRNAYAAGLGEQAEHLAGVQDVDRG